MPRLQITVLDLVSKGGRRNLFGRVMNPNLASIMPQVVAAWCEELGHHVRYICYTGAEDLVRELEHDTDVLIVGAFTRAAQAAYAISNLYRRRGVVTVLGGPHARCYREDAAHYFDYVLGFTDKTIIEQVTREMAPATSVGQSLHAKGQPRALPGIAARWKYIEAMLAKAPFLGIVPTIGSMGCPYTCSFCIDATVDYQPFSFDDLRHDLKFLLTKVKRPIVGWHDPNFGIRFNDYLSAIEDVVPPGRMRFIAESSLSILSEDRLRRLQTNGFVGMMPGIESWFELGNKSKTGNTILRHIPFVQTNFVLGLDSDIGREPFEHTKQFLDLSPGSYPAFSMLTAYGSAAPLNRELQRAGRVLPVPFPFLDGNHAMNVRPLNYDWTEIYAHAADITQYAMKGRRMVRRWQANSGTTRWVNLIRSSSSKRAKFQRTMHEALKTDQSMRRFFDGVTREIPSFYVSRVKAGLGPMWEALPRGALLHDENTFSPSPLAAPMPDPALVAV